ncbi:UDP-Glc:alpha-D-GlcNAc-diphosphoundecaprenol beta-1,3-glucosyltransferase WfgD [Lachnospiraceae bacterium]|nr:UDP-Glc:alpha-D-GlcNAc-diphosphoundecaprenol beta-1,3-glucosyltransferase WfgD [Lachnospiraceae bacterium]
MNHPLVTVVIPSYNREGTILRALNSVLEQTYTNIEVIVVDDCSTDGTVNAVEGCKDSRVQLLCLPFNHGANYARNRGIEKAKGEFIAFQDSDDEWMEDKLDKQISYMLEQNINASFCPYILYQGQKCQIVPSDYQSKDFQDVNIVHRLKKNSVVGTPTLVIKKEIVSQIGMFDEQMKRLQEYEFVIRLVKKYRLGFIDEPLVKAYRVGDNISSDNNALLDAYNKLIEKHSDFLELKSIINQYLNKSKFLENVILNWKDLDATISAIRNSQYPEAEIKCYQIIVEYLHRQCSLMKEMLKEWYSFYYENIKDGAYAIYGAGVYGHIVYEEMKSKNCIPRYFLVSEKGESQEIEGIQVLPLALHIDKDLPIIVAVSWERQKELIKKLIDKDIYKFCVYPFCR